MSEWEYYKLGELTEIGSSKRIFSSEYQDEGVPFWRGKEITELGSGKAVSTELFISEEKYNDIKYKHGVPSEGDILVTSVGTIGNVYQVKASDKFYFKDGNVTWIKKFNPKISSLFLYKWFNSNLAKREINAVLIGSTQQALTISALKELSIQIPEKSIQVEIANIIDTLDQKITLLREQNQTLEELAQTLFKRWFVEFEFPNENGHPYKSSGGKMEESELGEIPEGWRVGTLGEIVINHDSKRIPLSSNQRLKKQGIYPYHGATSIMDYVDDYIFDGRFLLLGEDGSVVDDKGFPILQYVEGKIWVNNHAHVLEGKNPFSTNYLFLLLKRTRVSHIVTGAVQLKINQGNLNSLEILIPRRDIVESFELNTQGLMNKIFSNNKEIQSLTQLRDTLLPKLMSGELRVKE